MSNCTSLQALTQLHDINIKTSMQGEEGSYSVLQQHILQSIGNFRAFYKVHNAQNNYPWLIFLARTQQTYSPLYSTYTNRFQGQHKHTKNKTPCNCH